jgi:hypothetical protein
VENNSWQKRLVMQVLQVSIAARSIFQGVLMTVRNTLTKRRMIDGSRFNAMSVAIISAAAFSVAPAIAQMQAPAKPAPAMSAKVEEAFKRADKNADGKLSKEEAAAMPAIAEAFDKADADKDGFLSKAEFADVAKE